MAVVELADRGTLFTFTTQEFLPKAPYAGPEEEADFTGFLLGYVELPEQVMVETRLVAETSASVHIGMEMQLVIVPFRREPDGTEVMTYAFAPVADATGGGAR